MKTVVFVCLLSLSMCLSVPTTNPEAPALPQQAAIDTKAQAPPKVEEKTHQENITTAEPIIQTLPQSDASNAKTTKAAVNNTTQDKNAKGDEVSTEKTTSVKPNEKPPATTPESKPAENKQAPAENKQAPAENKQAPTENKTAADDKANNTVVPAKKGAETTTVHSTAVSPSVAPNVTEKPVVLARGFDGASFVGGIILTLGLLAIGFMGFKYYKNQTERNYHTL